jgi:hypothetical protein
MIASEKSSGREKIYLMTSLSTVARSGGEKLRLGGG